MLKKYFDWTPSDIAAWEQLRAKGLPRFILWFGIQIFALWLFVIVAVALVLFWIKDALANQATAPAVLALQLLLAAAACLIGGFVAALSTWALEESIYRKLMQKQEGVESKK